MQSGSHSDWDLTGRHRGRKMQRQLHMLDRLCGGMSAQKHVSRISSEIQWHADMLLRFFRTWSGPQSTSLASQIQECE